MELEGIIIKVLPTENGTSGAGKDYTKCEFIVETEGQYPKKVAITNFNEKVPTSQLILGAKVKAHINLESRESKEKWYTSVNVWKLEVLSAVTATQQSPIVPPVGNEPPF